MLEIFVDKKLNGDYLNCIFKINGYLNEGSIIVVAIH